MTTGISLVRENTASLQPPRALWVSFPLGYPLGKPGDPEFQHQVIRHGLDLLERDSGPVLEDFPLDVPHVAVEQAPACPISFARPKLEDNTWKTRLHNELLLFRPWYDLSVQRRGRTTVGVSESSIDEIIARLAQWLDNQEEPFADLKWFKYAIEDAKAYYSESLSAQPGEYPAGLIQQQFWNDTEMGAALKVCYEYFRSHPQLEVVARMIAPREAIGGSTGTDDIVHKPMSDDSNTGHSND